MTNLDIKPDGACKYDLLALGEIMLRLDPGEGRVRTARAVPGLGRRRRIQRRARPAPLLRLEDRRRHRVRRQRRRPAARGFHPARRRGHAISSSGCPSTASGASTRNGLNFTERGFGVRGAVGIPDRGHTAASQLKPGDFDWDHIFGKLGVRWLHTGGIFAALSDTTPQLVIEAVQSRAAARHGGLLRPELSPEPLEVHRRPERRAQEVNREIAEARGRDDRQRGGLHRLPRLPGRRRGRTPAPH